MGKIIQHQEMEASDISELVAEAFKGFMAREWPVSVIEEMPGEYLVRLLGEIATLEERLSFAKRVAGEKAIAYGIPVQKVVINAKVSQQTAVKWRDHPTEVFLEQF